LTAFLFDTTALSEVNKPQPNRGFLAWSAEHAADHSFIGAPSVGELQIGITLLPKSGRRSALERWLERLLHDFGDRVLPFDTAAARVWGISVAKSRRAGRTLPLIDSQIAAIAKVHDLAVVTRNVRHFADVFDGLAVVSPWS
jgi:predicted nucleic acid-binding protein